MIIRPSRHFEGSDLGLDDPVVLSGADISEILQEIVGPIRWIGDNEGFCECPGAHLHTTKDAKKDCKFYLRPVPTLSCFHSSCRVTVTETCKRLRQLLRNAVGEPQRERLTAEEKALIAKVQQREALRKRAASSRQQILREVVWPAELITVSSPSAIPVDPRVHWRELFGLFSPEDVVWAGSIYDSGKTEHTRAFRPAGDWLKKGAVPGQFTCPSTFKPGSYARTNANVEQRRFLVVESDELDRDSIAGVFRWIREKVGLNLRAIVDTAGKSLHGWFDYPAEEELQDLRIVLPELGCDPKMFTASQPCRLPGALRDGRFQRLLYLNKEAAK